MFIFFSLLHRIVKTITSAVGDLNINSADSSAAIHAKCLICDKPVTSTGRARTALSSNGLPKNRSSSMVNSSTMPLLGYSKAMDDSQLNEAQLQHHENTMFNRLTSKDPNVSQQERVKVATELAIMRSSIEPLPDINVRMFCVFFHIFINHFESVQCRSLLFAAFVSVFLFCTLLGIIPYFSFPFPSTG